ncbi:MAG: 50S ribosomal protein L36 [Pseudomonadota bacterium]
MRVLCTDPRHKQRQG